jgi:hypothetical protein
MFSQFELVPGSHCILDRFQLRRIEFNNLPALRANHVIVVRVFVIVFVMGTPISKTDFACQASLS